MILADTANLDHCLYISHRINTLNRAPRILMYKNLSLVTHAAKKGLPSIPRLFMIRYWVMTPSATTRAKSTPSRQGNSRVRTILFDFNTLPINKCVYKKERPTRIRSVSLLADCYPSDHLQVEGHHILILVLFFYIGFTFYISAYNGNYRTSRLIILTVTHLSSKDLN